MDNDFEKQVKAEHFKQKMAVIALHDQMRAKVAEFEDEIKAIAENLHNTANRTRAADITEMCLNIILGDIAFRDADASEE